MTRNLLFIFKKLCNLVNVWGKDKNEDESNKIKNSTSEINLPVDTKDKKHKTFHREGENVIETLLIKHKESV